MLNIFNNCQLLQLPFLCLAFFASNFVLLPTEASYAGGGPERVFLVVNSNSKKSLTVANHYIDIRNVPASNVFYLPYNGSVSGISVNAFRKQILEPVFAEIEKRKLSNWIDYVVYSCDFPWRISFTSDFPDTKFPRQLSPRGSLTGLTYLHTFVAKKRPEVVSPISNWYFGPQTRGLTVSRAFRSSYAWSIGGQRAGLEGHQYMISSMLGVTDERGNTVAEIVQSLRLAKSADGTSPKGTVYFMKHGGPRSTPRHDQFPDAVAGLRLAGVAAEVLDGKFPSNKTGIVGLTCGAAVTGISTSRCRFLPGAFCDNLTSYGGVFTSPKQPISPVTGKRVIPQTNIADFIRHGATAACGTVYEPTNLAQKFPSPTVHVHYANGCSLGESFYQSVSGPYQQLLVGDPLCQPWAHVPSFEVDGLVDGAILRGTVEISPHTTTASDINGYELFVDGVRNQECKPGAKFNLNTTRLKDGHHELRVIAYDNTPIETQGSYTAHVIVKNGREAIAVSTSEQEISAQAENVTINVTSTARTPVEVYCNSNLLGELADGTGSLSISTQQLGAGPVNIYAESEKLRSNYVRLEIDY